MRTRQPFYGDPEDARLLPDEELGSMTPSLVASIGDGPLGFIPHQGANRQQRRASVANFQAEGADRRELWQQRQRQRRGKLDPELRRLQRRKAQTK